MSRSNPLSGPHDPHSVAAVHRGRPLTAVALLALTALVGCSGNPESAAPTERGTSAVPATVRSTLPTASMPSGTSGAPGTTAIASAPSAAGFTPEQQAILDAHDRAMASYQRAATAADPFDPTFKGSFTPDALRELQIRIQQRKDNGLAVRDAQPSKARISYLTVAIADQTATVTTCEVDDRVIYRPADGSVVNSKVSTSRWTVRMSHADGTWKVENRQQDRTWDGEEMMACLGAQQS